MRIIITSGMGTGKHAFGNMGDVAMVQASVARLMTLWPDAALYVLTECPQDLTHFCPQAVPLLAAGRDYWLGEAFLLGRLSIHVPQRVRQLTLKLRRMAALRYPAALRRLISVGLQVTNRGAKVDAISAFVDVLATTNLVVASGAGGYFDGCRDWNMQTLDIIEAAVQREIPVVMLGQHFGPLSDPEVLDRAKRILPAVNLITLRGNHGARALLESLGVPSSRIQVTGDEAIELAYAARPTQIGDNLGINFRLRTSAETIARDIELVRPILRRFADEHQTSLVPVPIDVGIAASDHLAIQQLLRDSDDDSNGGANLASPQQVIAQVGRCRVLVTCAYHAAVFALAQGIPVVALCRSRYFEEKFLGLKERFGLGCNIVSLGQPNDEALLTEAIERAWQTAQDVRVPLQESAVRQTQLIRDAYLQIRKFAAT